MLNELNALVRRVATSGIEAQFEQRHRSVDVLLSLEEGFGE